MEMGLVDIKSWIKGHLAATLKLSNKQGENVQMSMSVSWLKRSQLFLLWI